MKRLAIIPTVFALVVMVAACTDTTAPEDVTPQFNRASQPNCIEVLARFFAHDAEVGLKSDLEVVMIIADGAGVTTGTVIERLTGRTGNLGQCIGFLNGGG